MRVALQILVENTASLASLTGEYGFSALLTIDGWRVLFDTGAHDAVVRNAAALKLDLAAVQDVVISHGHFDHTGGIPALLALKGSWRFHLHPDAFQSKYVEKEEGRPVFIGMPVTRRQLSEAGATVVENTGPRELAPGVWLTGEIPRVTSYETTGGRFLVASPAGQWEEDTLRDDQALVIDHPEGLVVVSGCAHSGLVNTLEYARHLTGRTRVRLYLGGTHLMTAGPERMRATVEALRRHPVDTLVVCHCTGFYAAAELYRELGPVLVKGETGFRMVI